MPDAAPPAAQSAAFADEQAAMLAAEVREAHEAALQRAATALQRAMVRRIASIAINCQLAQAWRTWCVAGGMRCAQRLRLCHSGIVLLLIDSD